MTPRFRNVCFGAPFEYTILEGIKNLKLRGTHRFTVFTFLHSSHSEPDELKKQYCDKI